MKSFVEHAQKVLKNAGYLMVRAYYSDNAWKVASFVLEKVLIFLTCGGWLR